jgi:phage repressor protein C with HTH and peptisase S24 domain
MKVIERLEVYIKKKGISLNSIDVALNLSNGYIGKQIKSKASIGSDILQKIISHLQDLNPTWLLTGKGDMILKPHQSLSDSGKTTLPAIVVTDKKGQEQILMMDSKAAAGFPAHINDADFYKKLPTMALPQVSNQSGTFICVQITGDSMSPTIQHDQWVVARYEEEFENIRGGDICLVVTETNGVICKRIYPNKKTGGIECVSDNEQYTAFELQRGQYQQLYKFTCSISFTAPGEPASELRKEIKRFEKRLSVLEKKMNL